MKRLAFFSVITLFAFLGPAPAVGHDCCHHDSHYGDCPDCDHDCHHARQWRTQFGESATGATNLRAIEGKIAEVDYLPGATPEASMVEVRLQAGSQNYLVRLGPAGFLKQGGLLLREGETVGLKGFSVSGMEGDVFVATEVRHGDKTLSLRDARGRPVW